MARSPIAVVDDDESVRRSTRLLLESFGYQAAVFESTQGFLRFGPLRDTSCLLLDVHMPRMDGLRLQSQLVAKACGIPVIFITAYHDQESRRQALQDGAIALLGKPLTDQQLFEAIRSALRHD
jgi:FixJ family two-component response regulator